MTFEPLIIRALSLSERKRCVARLPLQSDFSAEIDLFKQWFDPHNSEPFRWPQFLKQNDLQEGDLLELAHAVAFRSASLPLWTFTLQSLMNDLRRGTSRGESEYSLARNLVRPVVRFAWRELTRHLLAARLQLFSPAAQNALRKSLSTRLERSVKQVLQWEWQFFRDACNSSECNHAQDEIAHAGFFAGGIESQLFGLLQRYPALARLWSQQVRNWIVFVADFVDHAEKFLEAIDCPQTRAISAIDSDLSDLHGGNRTVLKVSFSRAGTWYYKPRNGTAERGWSALLDWCNKKGFPQRFKTLRVVCRKDHCWMEAIPVRPCRSVKEAAAFFSRGGALLYLIHLLRGCDFHAGNLIAHGVQPVLVDCETLRHPATRLPAAAERREKDVLRTGLLPLGGILDDLSAFGRATVGSHQPRMVKQPVLARDFVEDFVSGFAAMHEFVRRRKTELPVTAEKLLPDHCRCLYRPTTYYETIFHSSLAPSILMSGFARSVFLQACCRRGSIVQRHIEKEVAALEDGDIPQFFGKASSIRRVPSSPGFNQSVALIRNSLRRRSLPR